MALNAEAATKGILWKKLFFKNFAKFTKNICAAVSCRPAVSKQERVQHRCFPVNFAKFCQTLCLQNTSGWLLLLIFFLLFHLSIIAKPSIIYIIGVPDYPSLIFAETNSFDKSRENWQQSRGVLRTPSNICDGAFSQKYFTSYVQRVWWQKL